MTALTDSPHQLRAFLQFNYCISTKIGARLTGTITRPSLVWNHLVSMGGWRRATFCCCASGNKVGSLLALPSRKGVAAHQLWRLQGESFGFKADLGKDKAMSAAYKWPWMGLLGLARPLELNTGNTVIQVAQPVRC